MYFPNPEKIRYFLTKSAHYPILAAIDEYGFHFSKFGEPYSTEPPESHGIKRFKRTGIFSDFKELDLFTILTKFTDEGRKKFISILKIEKVMILDLKDDDKERIISQLKNSRAFNEDSAMKIKDKDYFICLFMAENKIIGEYNGRFFIKNEEIIKESLTQGILNV